MSSKLNLSMPSLSLINTTVLNKSLSTMVKGIRGHKDRGELDYINKCINEVKEELATPYADVKAQALQKLIYLQMIGYDISWASFNIVEVMSAPWFGHKRIGYLAAALCFTPQTDVILLTTHLFRKGFTQPTSVGAAAADGLQYETGAVSHLVSRQHSHTRPGHGPAQRRVHTDELLTTVHTQEGRAGPPPTVQAVAESTAPLL